MQQHPEGVLGDAWPLMAAQSSGLGPDSGISLTPIEAAGVRFKAQREPSALNWDAYLPAGVKSVLLLFHKPFRFPPVYCTLLGARKHHFLLGFPLCSDTSVSVRQFQVFNLGVSGDIGQAQKS